MRSSQTRSTMFASAMVFAGACLAGAALFAVSCSKPQFDAGSEDEKPKKRDANPADPPKKARTIVDLDAPRGFAVDDKFVYWFSQSALLKIAAASTGGSEQIEVCAGIAPGPGPRLGGNYLYWASSDGTDVKLMAVSKSGGPATKAAVTKPLVRDLVADAKGVYWVSYPQAASTGEHTREGSIFFLPSPGEQPQSLAQKLLYPNLLALDSGGDLFFSSIDAPVVQRLGRTGGAVTSVDSQKFWTPSVAVTTKWVYWVRDKELMRASKAGGSGSKVAFEESAGTLALTGDGSKVIWAAGDGTVKSLEDDSKTPKLLAIDQRRIDYIATNASFIFWETRSAILSIPK